MVYEWVFACRHTVGDAEASPSSAMRATPGATTVANNENSAYSAIEVLYSPPTDREYTELGLVTTQTGQTIFHDRSAEGMIEKLRAEAAALGADAVNMGTRFCATQEAKIHPKVKQQIVDNTGSQSVQTELVATNLQGIVELVTASVAATSQTRAVADNLRLRAEQLKKLIDAFEV